MNLENYVNLGHWVEELNATIKEVLLERLKEAIVAWIAAFSFEGHGVHKSRKVPFANATEENAKLKLITIDSIPHELTIRNQVIFLEPPLEHARAICFASLHRWLGRLAWLRFSSSLGIVCNLARVQASRYELSVHRPSNDASTGVTYSSLVILVMTI